MEINCSTDKAQYITALKIESNGSILAIGDNQSVSYSFIPKRTDHLTSYTCVDNTHSSIMIEVTLIIRYAPAVTLRYTNGRIECDCDGVPPVYSVYRLDRISKYGELVYSINLDNGTFIFNTDQFPYQRNGRYVCVVSNGLPDANGKELQNSSTHVNYEGPPVFASENKYLKTGRVGLSITMSFYIYSNPDVEEIVIENTGQKPTKKIQPLSKNNRRYFVVLCSIAVVLFVYVVITHVWLCAKHVKTRFQRSHNVVDDHNYHTYDEISTISYRAVSNLRSSDTIANHGLNLTEQHRVGISIAANLQSTDDNLAELNDDFREDDLEQHDVTEFSRTKRVSFLGTTNISNTDVSRLPSSYHIEHGKCQRLPTNQ
ncbi:Hypothetical predicted protein [Mytilus galloprovincialis]|uniref:Ig-like domain-containing protein n=1 Tax=Mytilus galloprovincialis TaxID=29158 RepID=A0A8B6EHV0_MYTGA|nr:Hypothetical predicted protein [Mytilus galloprovincialis]